VTDIRWWSDHQQSGWRSWAVISVALGAALAYVFYTRRSELLIRVALLALGLTAFFFSSNRAVKIALIAGLLGLAAIIIFYNLGAGSLYDWDEAIYAQVSKEVTVSHQWVTPTLDGEPYFHKPPLYIWLTALAYRVGGVNEFSARFWSALFGFGVVALTMVLGIRLFSWAAGVAAALLLLSVDHSHFAHWHNFISQARVGMLETTLTFWILLSLILSWEARQRPKLIIWIGATAGLAVMTKSWPGLFALGLPVLFAAATGRFYQHLKYWLIAALLAGIIILPWHAAQLWLHGPTFIHDYVNVNLAGRVFGLVHQESRSSLFYFQILHAGFGAFGLLWPLSYVWALWTARKCDRGQKLLLLIWITVPLLLFSLANTKLGWYVIFIYPAIALVLARAAVELCGARTAVAGIAAVMALLYFRAPATVEGSPEIKHFVQTVAELVPATEALYVYNDQPCDRTASLTEYERSASQRLPPSLVFYFDRPIKCATADPDAAGRAKQSYFVVDTRRNALPPELQFPLYRDGSFILAALKPRDGIPSVR
jgi:4-amino-4-deoxy-L-arabinose transferase-like glycosyltransferase